ncbi:glucose-6-phosphate 1-dehydrogenase [Synechococcus phage S-H38]|uniref:Glucose-6-phosphate 1-dehydrogenase n=1 Tax=Synechococcus phage S-H38 TaxID=2783673 RepID=A0A873WDI5_9CAUD|nr:dehydrogenase [Synechococcus phage S-H38]QPB08028.1 glucose-6-phosphate 1-dehydrogenase [Synechococcus phage S-H38]
MRLPGFQYPLYYPQYISGYEKVKMTTTTQTTMMETAPLTRGIVIFGATGDLCKKKLIPALYKLWQKELLPENFLIIGSARRQPTTEDWKQSLGEYPDDFFHHVDYISADLSMVETLRHLPDYIDDMTYFLSVPPERYAEAIINLKEAGCLDDPERTRVVIEKPFGHDYKSADNLQSVVERHLREKQVYRIDHYLGKDTVNNILATRFGNILLEPIWNREYIEEIQIFATETFGCEGRAQYYETAGVVRDMLQNHILQVVSMLAMEAPCKMNARELRREKTKVLAATRLSENIILGQYHGYKDEAGVDPNSGTPTYLAGTIFVDNWRWKGVPFNVMTGKKMPYGCVEVVIKLKEPPVKLYEDEVNDRIVIRLQPNPHLDIRLDIKSPGLADSVEPATLTVNYPDDRAIDGYEKLLYDAISGDQSHFVHADEVMESWRIVDDILCTGDSCPIRTVPYIYTGGWGPHHKIDRITKWDYPA